MIDSFAGVMPTTANPRKVRSGTGKIVGGSDPERGFRTSFADPAPLIRNHGRAPLKATTNEETVRIVKAVNPARIKVVADAKDRVDRMLLLDAQHAGAKCASRRHPRQR